jgi:hypothetical protein
MVTNGFIIDITRIIWVTIAAMITSFAKVQMSLQLTLLPTLPTSLMLISCYAYVNGPDMARSADFSYFVLSIIFPETKVARAYR